ncbi:hypothetical protein [Novosphingobium sp. Gsoil 351]|uniref:hypothetical protein n=1 Tax=Novosphingobium sp. Gsoil 351 TaxID=2675225 RepID=UPI0012B4B20B|nr:hypothetical protein [Novosphingobium sp. Gsoil 351]QGN54762.1 hypothetical protein GKE62_09545 [Novosphingobium sp. Gsoil 351]
MIYGIPEAVFWTVGAVSVVIGLLLILRRERIVRCLRWWLIKQLRWVRSPRYRTYLRINGWLLFVLGTLMLVLMTLKPAR